MNQPGVPVNTAAITLGLERHMGVVARKILDLEQQVAALTQWISAIGEQHAETRQAVGTLIKNLEPAHEPAERAEQQRAEQPV